MTALRNKIIGAASFGLLVCASTTLLGQPTWQQTTGYPLSGCQYDVVENNGRIYVLGGYNDASLANTYFAAVNPDGSLGAWTAATALPQADQGPGVAVYKGWIYAALGNGGVYRAETLGDGSLGLWIAEPSIEVNTGYRLGLKAYKGFLYAFGRYSYVHYNVVRIAPIASNGSLGAWSTMTMPQARTQQAVHFYNDRVYLVGGITSGNVILDSVYSAPVNADGTWGTWRQEANLPTTLWYHSTVRIEDQIYLFGGLTGYSGGLVTNIYRGTINPDGTLSGWAAVDTMPSSYVQAPGAVFSPSSGRVFVIGGYSGSGATDEVWRKSFVPVDADGDGVLDIDDQCPNTPAGQVVNAVGCSISQLVPASWPWKNHGEYVSAVAHVAADFVAQGLITGAQKGAIVSAAAQSDIGKKR